VEGEDSLAEVSVTQAQLDTHFEASMRLVKWFAAEVREQELAWLKKVRVLTAKSI
jgi:hypothetical protein